MIQNLIYEAKQALLWFKEQIHELKEEAETRNKNTNEDRNFEGRDEGSQ